MNRIWLLHLVANAVLLLLLWEWLGIRDARAWQLVLTGVTGVLLLSAAVLLHAGTFHWFATGETRPQRGDLIRFCAALALFVFVCWLLSLIRWSSGAVWTASWFTLHLRKPVKPEFILRIFEAVRWMLQWVLMPILLLPVVTRGFTRESLRQSRTWRFWVEYVLVALVGFCVPAWLIHWVPPLQSTVAQVASFLLRFGVAYGLAITGWLALAFFSSRGMPDVSQPSTAVLP